MNTNNILLNRSFRLFFASVFFFSVFAGCVLLGSRMLNMDGDLGRHLTIGAYILDSGKIPTVDLFSNSMTGLPFTPHEWLSEVAFAIAYRFMGLTGVVLLTALLIAQVWYRLSFQVLRETRSFYVSLILLVVGIAASSIHWISRPHIFTYLFLMIWIAIYQGRSRIQYKSVALFVVMVIWVNTHGAFITGILYVCIDLVGKIIKTMISRTGRQQNNDFGEIGLVLLVSLLAIFVNPVGFKILDTIFGFLGNQYLTSHTMEYQAPNLLTIPFLPYALFLIISALIIIKARKHISAPDFLQIIIWSIFGLMGARNIPLAVLVGLPILGKLYSLNDINNGAEIDLSGNVFHPVKRLTSWRPFLIPPISIFFIALLLYGLFPGLGIRNAFLPEKFPVRATAYLKQHPMEGNMFNEFTWGGYLLYRLWPEQKVFIDGQTDFYGEKITRDYAVMYNAEPGFDELMQKYSVNWVIIRRTANLAEALDKDPVDWTKDYSDELTVIYERK